MGTAKKCGLLESALQQRPVEGLKYEFFRKTKDEGANRECFHNILSVMRKGNTSKVGTLLKADFAGTFVPSWKDALEHSNMTLVEIAPCLGAFFSVKEPSEIKLCKQASVLTNKVMKYGFIAEIEEILDKDIQMTHEDITAKIESIILDPSKIKLEIAKEFVDICFSPIVQSGGVYDVKVSAVSNTDNLSPDVILCSLGVRYKNYCTNISRTYMVDPCAKMEQTYTMLLGLYDACLQKCSPGNTFKSVYEEAHAYLNKHDPSLVPCLPKSFGFCLGLEFRDSSTVLNASNSSIFREGTVLNLSVALHNVPLSEEDKKGAVEAIQKLNTFSLLLADTILVQPSGPADILTKCSKNLGDVSYNLKEGDEEEEEDAKGTAFTEDGVRRSLRGVEEKLASESSATVRAAKQRAILERKAAEARKKLEKAGGKGDSIEDEVTENNGEQAVELETYKSPKDFPRDTLPTQIKVDLEKEALIVPIGGMPIPFHISTIKSVIMPEPDKATYLRINFYGPGAALGKEASKNMGQLVAKYGPQAAFIKELTYRSVDGRNLTTAFRLIQELRKRVRQREQKAEQEKDLVQQAKLIRIKDQRVPRLQDVTMRPSFSGRKCVGNLEPHQNGLRFTSNKGEMLDIMYANIKHAIFQPCKKTLFVLIHFHFKDAVMIGKKKCKDVQFLTEVVEASMNLDGARRSAYDPDELEDEQREREMRDRLNVAFKDFTKKVEKIAKHYDYNVEFDSPYHKLGFWGNHNKEMVAIYPTLHCLVNLTELPNFVVTLSEVDHVHFERVNRTTKNFDMTIIFKNWSITPKTITVIDNKYLEDIQDWLNTVDITYTEQSASMLWSGVMAEAKAFGDYFYYDHDADGEKKPVGWNFISEGALEEEEEDEEEEESDYSEDSSSEESSSEEDDDSDFDSESESDSDEDPDAELEEEGEDWEELEKKAAAEDRKRAAERQHEDEDERRKRAKGGHSSGGGGGKNRGGTGGYGGGRR